MLDRCLADIKMRDGKKMLGRIARGGGVKSTVGHVLREPGWCVRFKNAALGSTGVSTVYGVNIHVGGDLGLRKANT